MSSALPSSLIDRVLDGRYRVLSHVADGGMASVYVALDQRLDREVALKIMRPDLVGDQTFVTRFRREARSAARLSHPHVVAVYDQGEDGEHMFLAMELVRGQTLRQVMQAEGPLTPRAALDIIDPVLQALEAAHAAGLIHRDVKPENVILREDGTVKVADFGLARAVTSATSTAQTGVLLGTVAYLSPEQVERGVADARSDVYAAGLVFFEMLTGSKAFTGDSPIHVAYQHVHGEVPSPSSRVAGLPAQLDALVALATSRDPDDRPRDAGAFLLEVRRVRTSLTPAELDLRPGKTAGPAGVSATVALPRTASGSPPAGQATATTALPQPTASTAKAPRRRRRVWPLVALACVLLAGGTAWWFWTAGPGSTTTVPKLAGLTQQDAERSLARSHLDARVVTSFDETVKAGVVIAADPAVGTQVRRSSPVKLTVSQGPERYRVPTLGGSTQAEAEKRLAESRLTLGNVSSEFDEVVAEGQIISTTPAAGTSVKRGTPVALVVSKGREPIALADWTGKPADAAVKALTTLGLKVDATGQEFSSTVPKGSVISQSPAGGTVFKGSAVTLLVSKGPELVKVPAVRGKQEAQAVQILRAAGFQVQVSRIAGGLFGTAHHTAPAEGAMAPKGSTITLSIV